MSSMINYSQCWEDSDILEEALRVSPYDNVLSVTSGGDNTLALLSKEPRELIAIDMHAPQNFLLELKLASARNLDYEAYLELMGVRDSKRRLDLYRQVAPSLGAQAAKWWSTQNRHIEKGIIHTGKFESFLNAFRVYALPFVHSEHTVKKFLGKHTLEEQIHFYESTWNTWRWKLFFRFASGKRILKRFARQKEMTLHGVEKNTPHTYAERLEALIHRVPLHTNFFMQYCLLGRYGDEMPLYLTKSGYTKLRKIHLNNLHIETRSIFEYLRTVPPNTFTKCNLSDIFDALTKEQSDDLWNELVRVIKHGGRVAFWNNQIRHARPTSLDGNVVADSALSATLHAKDKVFFYESFDVLTISK